MPQLLGMAKATDRHLEPVPAQLVERPQPLVQQIALCTRVRQLSGK